MMRMFAAMDFADWWVVFASIVCLLLMWQIWLTLAYIYETLVDIYKTLVAIHIELTGGVPCSTNAHSDGTTKESIE